ncbi:MAG: DUF2628 domain-containing protein [Pirellulales bacterium]
MPSVAEFDQLDNPYRSSRYADVDALPSVYGAAEAAELQAFVGRKADYYLRKWAPRLESPDGEAGFNWAAFFLTALWMAYRKMYRNAIFCIVASWVVSLGLQLLFMFVFQSKSLPASAAVISNIMFCLVCGVLGNSWYLAHAQRKIAAARAQGLDGPILMSTLQQRGGTSWWAVLGLMFGPGLILFALLMLLAVMLVVAGAAS